MLYWKTFFHLWQNQIQTFFDQLLCKVSFFSPLVLTHDVSQRAWLALAAQCVEKQGVVWKVCWQHHSWLGSTTADQPCCLNMSPHRRIAPLCPRLTGFNCILTLMHPLEIHCLCPEIIYLFLGRNKVLSKYGITDYRKKLIKILYIPSPFFSELHFTLFTFNIMQTSVIQL